MSDVICFYHSADLDGICCGALFKKYLPGAELIGFNYGDDFPWEKVNGNTVYMADVSLPRADMIRLKSVAKELYFFDHHKTAIEYCSDLNLKGSQMIGLAGCELVSDWFAPGERTTAVTLLGRYDVWDHTSPDTLPFQYGMRFYIEDGVDDALWKALLDYPMTRAQQDAYRVAIRRVVELGQAHLAYQGKQDAIQAKVKAFETELGGYKILACNAGPTNSQFFDSVWDEERYEMMCPFYLKKDGRWKFSLYTTREDIDCSELAKDFGGGGHRKAAGFLMDTIPFPLG